MISDAEIPDIYDQLKLIPAKPGVYRFYNNKGTLLYIGKAKTLKNRVKSYFTSKKSHSYRIGTMAGQIAEVRYTVTNNEQEALTLENNLIKEYQPKYNIMLKDGKSYPFLCIKNERFPRVLPTRNRIKDGSEYFGPYTSVRAMNDMLELIRNNYKFRTCTLNLSRDNVDSGKYKICLEYQINNCLGPCENLITEKEYMNNIYSIKQILKGNIREIINTLEVDMQEASDNYNFERAEELRQQIERIKIFKKKNTVVSENISDLDVITLASLNEMVIINHFKIMNGGIVSTHTLEFSNKIKATDEELLLEALDNLESENDESFSTIILSNIELESKEFSRKFVVPVKGDKRKLVELSLKTCNTILEEKIWKQNLRKKNTKEPILVRLQKDLHMINIPNHIECFDNSNIQGENPVASLVVFKNGSPSNKDYRHFKIKTVSGPDDFASMREIVYRRYKRMLDEKSTLPDLVVIDGGKGQLNSAAESMAKLGILNKVTLIGIAKKLEEIYFVNDPYPLYIDKRSTSLKLIQQIRNEAHRFAITFHRNLRSKNFIKTELTDIPGIGDKTAKLLLKEFKSLEKIRRADISELSKLIGKKKAEIILSAYK